VQSQLTETSLPGEASKEETSLPGEASKEETSLPGEASKEETSPENQTIKAVRKGFCFFPSWNVLLWTRSGLVWERCPLEAL